jgi:hypothetical protein
MLTAIITTPTHAVIEITPLANKGITSLRVKEAKGRVIATFMRRPIRIS